MDIRINSGSGGDVNMMHRVKMIVTNGFDPDVRVYKEAKYLVAKGFDVEILCWDREAKYEDREVELIDGIKIKRLFPRANYGTGYKQVVPYVKFIIACKNYLYGKDYEYLHCHDLDGVIVGYFCRRKKCKLIFDMHEYYGGQERKRKSKYIINFFINYMHNISNYIIYLNEIQRKAISNNNIEKLIFVPNYPEKGYYSNINRLKTDKLRISYIGGVRQYNELKNLFDACIGIDDVNISIHGAGTAYSRLKEIEKNYNNVNITGEYHFSQSAEIYSDADILYVVYDIKNDNWRNAYPIKFFEAIITKTPVIVSKGSVLEEFLRENDIGFVVDGSNIGEIRDLIIGIINNRSLLDEKVKSLEKIQFKYT